HTMVAEKVCPWVFFNGSTFRCLIPPDAPDCSVALQVSVYPGSARVLGEQASRSDAGSFDERSRPSHYGPGTYWTIHITPEPEFSYVSFETNLSQTSYDDLIRKVIDVFKPGKFVTTLFVNQVCAAGR
ncbi:hypothetical protein GOODEAATRI_012455, partial [Goodea atripinnis]